MTGKDLKAWREANGLSQNELMNEIGVSSRQTMTSLEKSEHLPRWAELAIIALDQVEECRSLVGYKTQLTRSAIANTHFALWKEAVAGSSDTRHKPS
jgi:transcriptional regulator with XRE-family HTH domain